MKIGELENIVRKGEVAEFHLERGYIVVLDHAQVPNAISSNLAKDLRKFGVKATVLLVDLVEGRDPPLQVFEMRPDVGA